jgi:type I restriction enzyme S subunit
MFGDPLENPMQWQKLFLSDVSTKIGSGATPKGGKTSYKKEGISLIRSMNVNNNVFLYKDLALIDNNQAEKLNNVIVEYNDVLLNITGASVARCCVVPDDVIPARVNQHVSIIRSLKDELLSQFLCYQFTNNSFQKHLLNISLSSGATREALTKEQIENIRIIAPPIRLQNEFADFVQQVDKLKFATTNKL